MHTESQVHKHRPGSQRTSAWTACGPGNTPYGPELRMVCAFLKGSTTTKMRPLSQTGSCLQLRPTEELSWHRATARPRSPRLLPQEHLNVRKMDLLMLFSRLFFLKIFFFNIIKAHPYFSFLGFGEFPIFHKLRQQ